MESQVPFCFSTILSIKLSEKGLLCEIGIEKFVTYVRILMSPKYLPLLLNRD